MPYSERVESEARSAVETTLSSAYPVHGSACEVDRSGADVQVVSPHRYLVFHLFVE